MTIHAQVSAARLRLREAGITPTESDLDARLLAQHVLGWSTERFLIEMREPVPEGFTLRYDALVARRVTREPLAYIVGIREFWGLELEVNADVLIPRPATELIVEAIQELFPDRSVPLTIADVCTGCGCVAVAIAHERPTATISGSDISAPALEVARRNALRHGVAGRVTFTRGDLLAGINGTFDAIVANPPYVIDRARPALQPEVRDHEPPVALFGGVDGLTLVTRLVAAAPAHLRPGGYLIFEFGLGQDVEVEDLIEASRDLTLVGLRRDLQGIARTGDRAENVIMAVCLFCKIIAREIPAQIVYEDDRILAFNDINPQAPTHVLVIPKRHIATLNDLAADDDAIVGEMVRRGTAIAKARGHDAAGFRTVFNTNRDAGQTVFHIHLHVIGGRGLAWPPG